MRPRQHPGTRGTGVAGRGHDRRQQADPDRRAGGQSVLPSAARPGGPAAASDRDHPVGEARRGPRERRAPHAAGRSRAHSGAGVRRPPVGRAERRPGRAALRLRVRPRAGHRLQRARGGQERGALRGQRRAGVPARSARRGRGRRGRGDLRRGRHGPGGHEHDPGGAQRRSPLHGVGPHRAGRDALPAGHPRRKGGPPARAATVPFPHQSCVSGRETAQPSRPATARTDQNSTSAPIRASMGGW